MKRENLQIRFLIADTVPMYTSCLESFLLENVRAGRIEVANSKLELLDLMNDLHHDLRHGYRVSPRFQSSLPASADSRIYE